MGTGAETDLGGGRREGDERLGGGLVCFGPPGPVHETADWS
jgi:hypothetical protein